MFSQQLTAVEELVEAFASRETTSEEVDAILGAAREGRAPGPEQVWRLLCLDPLRQPDAFRAVLETSRSLKRAAYDGQVFTVSPLYATSVCQENCVYCNYRAGNRSHDIVRVRLSPQELEQEARFLIQDRGLRVLELVYATDPKVRVPQICEHIRTLRRRLDEVGGGVVGLNAEPFDLDDYVALREAGLDFCALWQETYNRAIYPQLHSPRHKKARFDYRVDAFERMLLAGIPHLGIGILSGLAPWRKDWFLLLAHERYLEEHYGRGPEILGTPRLKPAPGAELMSSPYTPTEEEYLLAIAVHNIARPRCLPWISTREAWPLCTQAAAGGGTLFTLDCSTIPGGYTVRAQGYQFPVNSFDSRVYAGRLAQHDLHPVFHWNFWKLRGEG